MNLIGTMRTTENIDDIYAFERLCSLPDTTKTNGLLYNTKLLSLI